MQNKLMMEIEKTKKPSVKKVDAAAALKAFVNALDGPVTYQRLAAASIALDLIQSINILPIDVLMQVRILMRRLEAIAFLDQK
jgi:hypothetical protein